MSAVWVRADAGDAPLDFNGHWSPLRTGNLTRDIGAVPAPTLLYLSNRPDPKSTRNPYRLAAPRAGRVRRPSNKSPIPPSANDAGSGTTIVPWSSTSTETVAAGSVSA